MKTFIHHDLPSLRQINSEGGRTYLTENGKQYPSVTTVLGLHKAQSLQAWRNAVGHEEANRISSKASKRGTAIHSLCEDYLKEGVAKPNMFDQEMFNTLKPHLDKIDNIHCLESRLFSHTLKIAGSVDVIAEYDGELHIIDFKTSGRIKSREDIGDYFMQCSAYSFAFWEMTGILVNKSLIIMGVDDSDALTFREPITPWLKEFKYHRQEYARARGI